MVWTFWKLSTFLSAVVMGQLVDWFLLLWNVYSLITNNTFFTLPKRFKRLKTKGKIKEVLWRIPSIPIFNKWLMNKRYPFWSCSQMFTQRSLFIYSRAISSSACSGPNGASFVFYRIGTHNHGALNLVEVCKHLDPTIIKHMWNIAMHV